MRAAPPILTLLLMALPPLAAVAQGGDSSIFGLVVYRGAESANSRVYIGREGKYRQVTSKFKAGQNIGFRMDGVLPGRYELLVTAPGGQPRRIWGVKVQSFEQKQVDVALDRCTTPEQELFYIEQGAPRSEDTIREWEGGWIQGSIVNEKGQCVDGRINLLRGVMVYRQITVGTPTLPAYYEDRNVTPGLYDLEYEPPANANLKRVRIEGVTIAPRSRTILGTIRVPLGSGGNALVKQPLPERVAQPLR